MMKGWKTWLAVAMAIAYAVGGYTAGAHGADKMIEVIIAAVGLVGVGHKLDKASAAEIVKTLPEVTAEEVAAEVVKAPDTSGQRPPPPPDTGGIVTGGFKKNKI